MSPVMQVVTGKLWEKTAWRSGWSSEETRMSKPAARRARSPMPPEVKRERAERERGTRANYRRDRGKSKNRGVAGAPHPAWMTMQEDQEGGEGDERRGFGDGGEIGDG